MRENKANLLAQCNVCVITRWYYVCDFDLFVGGMVCHPIAMRVQVMDLLVLIS